MNNLSFFLLSEEDKQKKLYAILKNCTNNALSNDDLRELQLCIKLHRQYYIMVHLLPESFCNSLVLARSDARSDKGKIVFGQALFGWENDTNCNQGQLIKQQAPAAAIIAKHPTDANNTETEYTLHIYIPQHLYEKGTIGAYEQR